MKLLPHSIAVKPFGPTPSVRPETSLARPGDKVVFGAHKRPEGRSLQIRQGLFVKTIGLLAPLLAVSGCSVPIPGKSPDNERLDIAAVPSAPMDDSVPAPNTSESSQFLETAMALNGGTSTAPPASPPSEPALPQAAPAAPTDTSTPVPPPPDPALPQETAPPPVDTSTPVPPPPEPALPQETVPPPVDTSTPVPPPPEPVDSAPTAANNSIRIMSQNVWGINHANAVPNWEERMVKIADIIKNSQSEIIATQETEPAQFSKLKELLGGDYQTYPAQYIDLNKQSQRTIIYRSKTKEGKPLWEVKNGDSLRLPIYKDKTLDERTGPMPWARFVHAGTGQEVVILSLHAVAYDDYVDKGGALKREKSGHLLAEWAREMKAKYPGALVVIAGDANSRDTLRPQDQMLGDRMRLIPCILGKELQAADDQEAGREGICPINDTGLDHVYSNSKKVANFHKIHNGQSDHGAVLVDLTLFEAPENVS